MCRLRGMATRRPMGTGRNHVRIAADVPPAVRERLGVMADACGISRSALLEWAIRTMETDQYGRPIGAPQFRGEEELTPIDI